MLPEIDLTVIFKTFEGKVDKDIQRGVEFFAACQKKAAEIIEAPSPYREQLPEFIQEAGLLIADWFHKALHLQFPADLLSDPFASLRHETRAFSAKWVLDPVFINALG